MQCLLFLSLSPSFNIRSKFQGARELVVYPSPKIGVGHLADFSAFKAVWWVLRRQVEEMREGSIWILFKISIAARRASLIKMVTLVREGLTVCPWELSVSKRVKSLRFCFRWGLRRLCDLIVRYRVVRKSILKKKKVISVPRPPPPPARAFFALVGSAVFKLLICLLWILRNGIFLPHLLNQWLRLTAYWKWVPTFIRCVKSTLCCLINL